MEARLALSADLACELSHNEGQLDGSGYEMHALTLLPQAADPVNPQDTLSTHTPVSLANTFALHSKPDALHKIYLDFDGHTTTGTHWNTYYNAGQSIVSPAYDLDGNPASFSDSEFERIQWIWERVAEDFIPFNVDVTTEDPGVGALSKSGATDAVWGVRVVIGGSSTDWYGSSAGGVAYVGSFNWASDTPAFVFKAQLGNGHEKYTAEAISHEVGHTLGLSHDGRLSPSEEYYQGHGSGETSWGPIMGSSYYSNVTQWSKGEYASASQKQDDLAIITGNNGFSYRVDDRGNTNSAAWPLNIVDSTIRDWGIIERANDVDVFSFVTDAGQIQIDVAPLNRGPNLDVQLAFYDAAFNLVATANPANVLSASISLITTAQQYYLHVSGTGNGDPLSSGYSSYASLGQYFISGSIVSVPNDYLSISAVDAHKNEGNSGSSDFTFVVNRTGNTTGSTTVNYTLVGSGSSAASASDFTGNVLPSGSLTFAPGETSKTINALVAGDIVAEGDEGFTVSLSNASGATVISQASADGLIVNDDVSSPAGITVTPTSGLIVKESRSTASFTVVLNTQPTADVTIQVTSLDTTEGTVNTGLLRFTSANWNVPQKVTVSGVDDTLLDGDISFAIKLWPAQSNDPNYNNRDPSDVQVVNQDNERAKGKKTPNARGSRSAVVDEAISQIQRSAATPPLVILNRPSLRPAQVAEEDLQPETVVGDNASRQLDLHTHVNASLIDQAWVELFREPTDLEDTRHAETNSLSTHAIDLALGELFGKSALPV